MKAQDTLSCELEKTTEILRSWEAERNSMLNQLRADHSTALDELYLNQGSLHYPTMSA